MRSQRSKVKGERKNITTTKKQTTEILFFLSFFVFSPSFRPLTFDLFPLTFDHSPAFADTVILTQGQEVKGLILEEYVDRILLSTYQGEKIIFKNEIQVIHYDSIDKQWIQKGNAFRELEDYEQALSCYKKALEANPQSEQIKLLVSSTRARLDEKLQQKASKAVELRNSIAELGGRDLTESPASQKKSPMERLRSELGLILKEKEGNIQIGIRYGSPASQSGFQSGDTLLVMDGEPASYRSTEEIAKGFLQREQTMLETVIERTVFSEEKNRASELGCQFSMEYEGLTVQAVGPGSLAEKMGLAAGDRVTQINGASARYLPFREAMALIEQALKAGSLTLTIQRQLWLMREAP